MERSCGILMPVSSLPSDYGIGCFSKEAYEFVDQLAEAGQSYWQILPLGPTSFGDSPYQSFSTFAGNPYFIDLKDLLDRGWLDKGTLRKLDFGSNPDKVDYEALFNSRFLALRIAFENSSITKSAKFKKYVKANEEWLIDYALYMAIKTDNDYKAWQEWDEPLRNRDESAIKAAKKYYKNDILFYEFQQYIFNEEWQELKSYANKKGIKIIGDVPIYVALDSADTWSNWNLFQFDKNGSPIGVAGCPPDAFTALGQLWGNPLYDWNYHKKTSYAWWIKRLRRSFELYDVVRLDHFIGFNAYYSIPFGAENAVNGKYLPGPGIAFFNQVKKELGDPPFIAENLGVLTPEAMKLLNESGYPGMKVLQFAFDGGDSDYQPHHYERNCVVYTGTHDNDTTFGWFKSRKAKDRALAVRYLHLENVPIQEIPFEFIRAAYASVADLAIIPIQDFLGIGSEGRINYPSTIGTNWQWRMGKRDFGKRLIKQIREMAELYGRAKEETPSKRRRRKKNEMSDETGSSNETTEALKAQEKSDDDSSGTKPSAARRGRRGRKKAEAAAETASPASDTQASVPDEPQDAAAAEPNEAAMTELIDAAPGDSHSDSPAEIQDAAPAETQDAAPAETNDTAQPKPKRRRGRRKKNETIE